jgi:UDP-GlcNAc:undecaprenyl-phosphate GlcNAc-1-phosphate transferase
VTFPFNVYLAAFLSAFATTLAVLPLWRKWCIRKGLVDDPGHRKIHDEPVPLAGGLGVMTGILIPLIVASLLLWSEGRQGNEHSGAGAAVSKVTERVIPLSSNITEPLLYGLNKRIVELLAIAVGAVGMLIVGLLDDLRELKPGPKFVAQFVVALLVASSGARITLFVHNEPFHYAVTILWVLTVINAFNFMDNMNGLCGGLAAIGAWYFALISAAEGEYLVALIAFLTFGALVGFLPYNFPRGRIFLGDSGSHLNGYLMAVLAILPHFYSIRHPRPFAVLIPLLVLAIPLADMVWVVLLRRRMGRPFYVGDTNHLSHRLVRCGLSRTLAVLVIWVMAVLSGAFAFYL